MAIDPATVSRSVHNGLQTMYQILKERGFSPGPLDEEKELDSAIQQVLQFLPLVTLIDGSQEEYTVEKRSCLSILLGIARHARINGWDESLLGSLSECHGREEMSLFDSSISFDQIAIEVNPEIFLHIFRNGANVDSMIDSYFNYLQLVSKKQVIYSAIPLFVNPLCSECKGKGTVIDKREDKGSKRAICPTCNGKGKLPRVKNKVNLFYLQQKPSLNREQTNSLIKNYWKHFASTKLKILGNAVFLSKYMGKQTRVYFESCNNATILSQYKISLQKLGGSMNSFWMEFEEFREHDRIVHLRNKLKKDTKTANRKPADKKARKRVNKGKNAINEIYRAYLEIYAGKPADVTGNDFVGRSLDIAKQGKFHSTSWKKLFEIYHPELVLYNKELKEYFTNHYP